ncbi:MAG: septal ring lytic transglycosylase RlpA family protein [Polyangiales bacterium]
MNTEPRPDDPLMQSQPRHARHVRSQRMRRARVAPRWMIVLLSVMSGCGGSAGTSARSTEPTPRDPAAQTAPPPAGEPTRHPAPPPMGGTTTPRATTSERSHSPYAAEYGRAPALETLEGRASYYSDRLAGRSTASGEPYRTTEFTAASRDLRFGTILRVTRADTGAVTYVRVNDRGPFGDRRRIVDLSRVAAEELGMIRAGVVDVRVEIVHRPTR